ncbi:MAG: glutathione S-transferase [Labilithrix sp.]|nr:glutathione S-transferase [Labilithrix sp.]
MSAISLVGRSSSHFTRVARIFALELGLEHTFRPVLDLTTLEPAMYAGNPALKIPVLVDEAGPLFGTENICRELALRSGRRPEAVLRGDVRARVVANVEELTLHVMSAEVSVIMAKASGEGRCMSPKTMRSIENALRYLDENVEGMLSALPPQRTLSFVEVALFCAVTHLPFREVLDVSSWTRLEVFCSQFAQRPSARGTEYRFDAA